MPLGLVSLLPLAMVLVAAPFLLAFSPKGAPRRAVAASLAVFALAHAGLYLLYVSRAACWTLVSAAALLGAWTSGGSWRRLAALGAAALVAGVAFQLDTTDAGLVLYVAGAAPALLLAGLVPLLARWGRWRWDGATAFVAATWLAWAAFVPLTSFSPSFLLTFEPYHAPLLALALAGTGLFARRVAPAVASAREAIASARSTGEISAMRSISKRAAPGVLAGLLAGAVLLAASSALLVADGGSARLLFAACIVAAVSATLLARSLAADADAAARERALREEAPPRAIRREGDATVQAALDARLAAIAARAPLAVLCVRAPRDDPFWTLPSDLEEWLASQPLDSPRVHVAIEESDGRLLHMPPLVEVRA